MKPTASIPLSIVIIVVLAICAYPASADVAPPPFPPGSNVSGEEGTLVEMTSEVVTITVGEETMSGGEFDVPAVTAEVVAEFRMTNTGSNPETMDVRFPLSDPRGSYDSVEVTDFFAFVDGRRLEWSYDASDNPLGEDLLPIFWAQFPVTFPAGRPVNIRVEYTILSTGYLPEARFNYIFETGAGWHGPIGRADLILVLPYQATHETVLNQMFPGLEPKFDGNKVTWTVEALEPDNTDNWSASIIFPSYWEEMSRLRTDTIASPEDGQLWLALAESYLPFIADEKPVIRIDGAGQFVPLAEDAYRRAIAFEPENVDAHYGYALTLFTRWINRDLPGMGEVDINDFVNEINILNELRPGNPDALDLYETMVTFSDQPVPAMGGPSQAPLTPAEVLLTPIPHAALLPADAPPPTPVPAVTQVMPTPANMLAATASPEAAQLPPAINPDRQGLRIVLVVLCCGALIAGVILVAAVLLVTKKKKK